jgi:GT2 family glycosyltransferase
MTQAEPQVTVAVVSWNTRELLGRCLDSLRGEVSSGRASVWVVDNGSTDGSPDLMRESYDWANLVEPNENIGFGRAVNLVASRVGGRWIAAANADIELTDGALGTLIEASEGDATAGAIAPRLLLPDGTTQHSVHSFPTLGLALAVGLGLPHLSRQLGDRLCIEGRWDPDRARIVDWAHGAFMLVRRDAFDAINGFDPAQWMYAEDIDLAWRLRRAGFKIRYEPRAVVLHAHSASTRQSFGEAGRARRHIAASYAWLLRRRGLVVTRSVAVVNVTAAATRYALLTPLSWLGSRWARARQRQARRYVRMHRLGLRSRARIMSAA